MNDSNGLPRNDFARITRHEKGQAICHAFTFQVFGILPFPASGSPSARICLAAN